MTVIGIDLATTYSCVATYRNGAPEVIPNEQGNRSTPSWVAFTDSEILVGEAAKNQAAANPKNSIFEVKRMMGKVWDDPILQEDIKRFPYEVFEKNGKPCIRVTYKGEKCEYTPEQISAFILGKLKTTAEEYLGEKVTKCVVTCPAHFSNEARQSTKDACLIAGMECLRIINEPTAACLAHQLEEKGKKERKIVILDTGGGTCDVSILSVCDGVYEVLATGGDTHLGGQDIDHIVSEFCAGEFKRKTGYDILGNHRAMTRLRSACEKAKRILSSSAVADIEIDSLAEGEDFSYKLTRAKFDALCGDFFKRFVDLIGPVLRDANLSKREIDDVVIVGGTMRIPKIQELVVKFFDGKEINKSANLDEAVAAGASIQASILAGEKDEKTMDILLLDVCPLSVGIEVNGSIMNVMIARNSTIPCEKKDTFSTARDNQPGCTIRVFEGERQFTADNHLLGQFDITGIPPAPRGVPKIEVTYSIDANGILNVSAKELSSGKSGQITIKSTQTNLSKEEIARMVAEAEKHKEEDLKRREKVDAKNQLESAAYHAKNFLDDEKIGEKIGDEDKKKIREKADEVLAWLESGDYSKDEYKAKEKELQDVVFAVTSKLYADAGPMPSAAPSGGPMPGPKVDEVD